MKKTRSWGCGDWFSAILNPRTEGTTAEAWRGLGGGGGVPGGTGEEALGGRRKLVKRERCLVADHLERTPPPEAAQLTEAPRLPHVGGGSSRCGKTWLAERGIGRARQGWRVGAAGTASGEGLGLGGVGVVLDGGA